MDIVTLFTVHTIILLWFLLIACILLSMFLSPYIVDFMSVEAICAGMNLPSTLQSSHLLLYLGVVAEAVEHGTGVREIWLFGSQLSEANDLKICS